MVVFLSLSKHRGPSQRFQKKREPKNTEVFLVSCLTLRKVHFVLLLKRGQTNCNKCYVLDTFRKQIEKLIQGVPKRNKGYSVFVVSWKCFVIINTLTGNALLENIYTSF